LSRPLAALPEPAALLFDLDGTLVDTVGTRIEGWLRTFAEIGLPAEREHLARLIGADGKRLAREVATAAGRALDDERAEAIDRRAGQLYDELNTSPRPVPGARRLLLDLQAGHLPWAIATSSRAEQVLGSVKALRLERRPIIVDGSHVAHAKPAPDLLLIAAERLAVPRQRTWYVGDSTWDMLAAVAAGMVAVGIASGAASESALVGAGAHAVTGLRRLDAELRRRRLMG